MWGNNVYTFDLNIWIEDPYACDNPFMRMMEMRLRVKEKRINLEMGL